MAQSLESEVILWYGKAVRCQIRWHESGKNFSGISSESTFLSSNAARVNFAVPPFGVEQINTSCVLELM